MIVETRRVIMFALLLVWGFGPQQLGPRIRWTWVARLGVCTKESTL